MTQSNLDTLWVVVAALFVLSMQAGFLLVEVGFSRMKNAGTVVAKVLANFSLAALSYWAVGFALAFGATAVPGAGETAGWLAGNDGFFLHALDDVALPALAESAADPSAKFIFEFAFCAVSLAIVWGTTLERIKFEAHLVYAVVFSALIYPVISHWVFGGGWLMVSIGMQDFAGSTVVHMIGATGALAALLLLGPRSGKFDREGNAREIPGHSMPLVGLGVMILLFGWFGFNAGSTLGVDGNRFADITAVTLLGGASGVLGAMVASYLTTGRARIDLIANGLIAGLVGITAGSGYVLPWAAVPIGLVAGALMVVSLVAIDRLVDDPIGALSAHGVAGVWGTLACGLFTTPALAELNGVGEGGLVYTGSFEQLGAQALGIVAAFVAAFSASIAILYGIKRTIGLRVDREQERAGLDIAVHGTWGYPEQFTVPETLDDDLSRRLDAPPAKLRRDEIRRGGG